MKQITEFLAEIAQPGAKVIGLEATTKLKLPASFSFKREKGLGRLICPQIFKKVIMAGFVGTDYGRAVNKQAEREGLDTTAPFKPAPLPWGVWLVPNKIIAHENNLYLRIHTFAGQRARQPKKVAYVDETGLPIPKEIVEPHLNKTRSSRQRQFGIEGEIIPRTYDLRNITRIRLNGKTFE
jgi:hypothetical protein